MFESSKVEYFIPAAEKNEMSEYTAMNTDLFVKNHVSLPLLHSFSNTDELYAYLADQEDDIVDTIMEMFWLVEYVRSALIDRIKVGLVEETYNRDTLKDRILLLENTQRGLYNTISAITEVFDEESSLEMDREGSVDAHLYKEQILQKKMVEFQKPRIASKKFQMEKVQKVNEVKPEVVQNILAWEQDLFQLYVQQQEFSGDDISQFPEDAGLLLKDIFTFMGKRFSTLRSSVRQAVSIGEFKDVPIEKFQKMNIDQDLFVRLESIYRTIGQLQHQPVIQYYLYHKMFSECSYYLHTNTSVEGENDISKVHTSKNLKMLCEFFSIKKRG